MEAEVFVHGVPSGEGFWGKEEDRNYFGNFYDHSSDEVKFLIQTRASQGKSYCYYNYLVYKSAGVSSPNIVGYDGRDGSYFGISLRLDAYCKDVMNMYRILDTVYNVYILGDLLKMEKAKLKYTTPDFASVSRTLETIEYATIQLIQKGFSNESFTRLDGFALNGSSYLTCNLYDCTPDHIQSTIKQCSRVAISPYYSTGKEAVIQQQCNTQIQTLQQQHESRLKADADICAKEKNEINTLLSAAKSEALQFQDKLTQKDETIQQLKAKIAQLQSELKMVQKSKEIGQIVETIKGPVAALTTALQQVPPGRSEREDEERKEELNYSTKKQVTFSRVKMIKILLPFLNFLLLLIIVGLLLNSSKEKAKDDSNEKVESLEKKNQESQTQIEAQANGKEGIQRSLAVDEGGIDHIKIDLKSYNGGKLALHTKYTVEAINSIENGTWEVEGCEKIADRVNPNKIQIIPNAASVKIVYRFKDKTEERTLAAQ